MHQTGEADPNEAVRLDILGRMGCFKTDPFVARGRRRHLLSVTSDGTTGEDWITRLSSKGFPRGDYAKQVLRSPDFKPTQRRDDRSRRPQGRLFEDNDRITKKVRAECLQALAVQAERRASLASSVRSSRTRRSKPWAVRGYRCHARTHQRLRRRSVLLDAHRYGGGRAPTRIATYLAAEGRGSGLRSPCRKSFLKLRYSVTSVFSNLVLSPISTIPNGTNLLSVKYKSAIFCKVE